MAEQSMDGVMAALQEVFLKEGGPRALLELLANGAMRAEVAAHVGAGPHERSAGRRGRRNGAKPRTLRTRVGELALSVPQVRGCEPYHPSLFARWQRSERALLVACGEMYFQGVARGTSATCSRRCAAGTSAR